MGMYEIVMILYAVMELLTCGLMTGTSMLDKSIVH